MPIEQKPFNHRVHLDTLEEAEQVLRDAGQTELAVAVAISRRVHQDWMSRVGNGRTAIVQLKRQLESMRQEIEALEKYTTQPQAPWIGCDLFPLNT